MEPQERAKFLQRKKKTESLGMLVEDLSADDSTNFKSGDKDDDDDETGDARALVVQPKALVVEIFEEDDLVPNPASLHLLFTFSCTNLYVV